MELHWYYNKEFDEGLLRKIPEISFEDEMKYILSASNVGNYLVSGVNFKYFNCIR